MKKEDASQALHPPKQVHGCPYHMLFSGSMTLYTAMAVDIWFLCMLLLKASMITLLSQGILMITIVFYI